MIRDIARHLCTMCSRVSRAVGRASSFSQARKMRRRCAMDESAMHTTRCVGKDVSACKCSAA
eukprot:scaffold10585_cov32-Tisochrysis_lutea.AAC.3